MASAERGHASDEPAMVRPIPLEAGPVEYWRRARKLFDTLPSPPITRLPDKDVSDLTKWQTKPKTGPAEALQNCADALEKYDAEECKVYREEIDTLLVFAGLFSAVVTAFSIESYQWLQSDPNDAIIALLSQIAHPTNQSESRLMPQGPTGAVSTRINAYWFLSLALSLSAALVAIMCKQWVREFERHSGLSNAAQYIGIRQMKLEGFESWRVAGIVAAIPLLLQCALGLFALGLLELLWNLHVTVAIVVLIPTSAAFVFYALTTVLPGIQAICDPFSTFRKLPQCPFKSAQAMLALRFLVLLPLIVRWCCGIPLIGWEFLSTKFFEFWRTEQTPDSDMERGETHSDAHPESTQPAADAEQPSVPSAAQAATRPDSAPRPSWRRFFRLLMRRDAHPGNDMQSQHASDRRSNPASNPERRASHSDSNQESTQSSAEAEEPSVSSAAQSATEPDGAPHRPSWRRFFQRLWMRREAHPGNDLQFQQASDRWSTHSLDSAQRFPGFAAMESWLSMDQAFTSLRDGAYTQGEYQIALREQDWGKIPPALFFRGLSWLRDHVHQPEINSWIFWSIWERVPAPESVSAYLASARRDPRLLYGIHTTLPPDMILHTRIPRSDSPPVSESASLALLYGQHVRIDPSFIAEAFIQHISSLEKGPAIDILFQICLDSGTNGDIMISILHALLARALQRPLSQVNIRRLLHHAFPHILRHPRAVIHPALACVIAVYLEQLKGEFREPFELERELRRPSELERKFPELPSDAREDLRRLLDASIRYLGCDQEPNILTVGPSGEKAVYAALAVAVDQCLETVEDTSEDHFASTLVQPGNREVYLDLLTTALGSRDTAMARLERNAGRLAQRYTDQERARIQRDALQAKLLWEWLTSPIVSERRQPELSQATELHITEQQGESSTSTGAGPASPTAHPAPVAPGTPSRLETDNPWSSA